MRKLVLIPVAIYAGVAGSGLFLALALSASSRFRLLHHIGRNVLYFIRRSPQLCKDLWTDRAVAMRAFGSMWISIPILIVGAPFILTLLLLDDYIDG